MRLLIVVLCMRLCASAASNSGNQSPNDDPSNEGDHGRMSRNLAAILTSPVRGSVVFAAAAAAASPLEPQTRRRSLGCVADIPLHAHAVAVGAYQAQHAYGVADAGEVASEDADAAQNLNAVNNYGINSDMVTNDNILSAEFDDRRISLNFCDIFYAQLFGSDASTAASQGTLTTLSSSGPLASPPYYEVEDLDLFDDDGYVTPLAVSHIDERPNPPGPVIQLHPQLQAEAHEHEQYAHNIAHAALELRQHANVMEAAAHKALHAHAAADSAHQAQHARSVAHAGKVGPEDEDAAQIVNVVDDSGINLDMVTNDEFSSAQNDDRRMSPNLGAILYTQLFESVDSTASPERTLTASSSSSPSACPSPPRKRRRTSCYESDIPENSELSATAGARQTHAAIDAARQEHVRAVAHAGKWGPEDADDVRALYARRGAHAGRWGPEDADAISEDSELSVATGEIHTHAAVDAAHHAQQPRCLAHAGKVSLEHADAIPQQPQPRTRCHSLCYEADISEDSELSDAAGYVTPPAASLLDMALNHSGLVIQLHPRLQALAVQDAQFAHDIVDAAFVLRQHADAMAAAAHEAIYEHAAADQ